VSDASTQHTGPGIRASDAEREQTVALLRRDFADGRLTQAELKERAGAAYAAQTRAKLLDLTADLPAADQPPQSGMVLDRRLLIILLCVHPPAALVYWLVCRRGQPATTSTVVHSPDGTTTFVDLSLSVTGTAGWAPMAQEEAV
jgi:hypothetical protein